MSDRPRRSAGMRGTPTNNPVKPPPAPLPVKPRPQAAEPARTPSSRFAKPTVLMDETSAPKPKGEIIRAQRDAFRAFMTKYRLRPTEWAKAAGVAPGEILGFLTGQTRSIAPATLEKLAVVAKAAPQDLLR